MDDEQKNDETERATGLNRKMNEAIGKRNQMTAPRFQTGGWHQTSLAPLRGITRTRLIDHFYIYSTFSASEQTHCALVTWDSERV